MKTLLIALRLFVALTVLTGVLYPLLVTGIAQAAFPSQANGSLIVSEGRVVGSTLVGQSFDQPHYFWGRPSATGPVPYNAAASSGSNLGPTNPALVGGPEGPGLLAERVAALRAMDPGNANPVPTDLVTASGSGLDPHISVAAAEYQVARVARTRGMSEEAVRALVREHTVQPAVGILGERVVVVLPLNLALDRADR